MDWVVGGSPQAWRPGSLPSNVLLASSPLESRQEVAPKQQPRGTPTEQAPKPSEAFRVLSPDRVEAARAACPLATPRQRYPGPCAQGGRCVGCPGVERQSREGTQGREWTGICNSSDRLHLIWASPDPSSQEGKCPCNYSSKKFLSSTNKDV